MGVVENMRPNEWCVCQNAARIILSGPMSEIDIGLVIKNALVLLDVACVKL